MATTVEIFSDNVTNSGLIEDIGGTKTAYANDPFPSAGVQINEFSDNVEWRAFYHFNSAGVVPVGKIVTKLEWRIRTAFQSSAPPGTPNTWKVDLYWGQTFISTPLATGDWAGGTHFQNYGGPLTDGTYIELTFIHSSFDRTLDFDLGVHDASGYTDNNAYVELGMRDGAPNPSRQRLRITYQDPAPAPNIAVLSTPHAGI